MSKRQLPSLAIALGTICTILTLLGFGQLRPRAPEHQINVRPRAANTPMVGTPKTTPALLTVNTPTAVTVTSQITDPTLIPGSVNLLRLGATGTQPTVLGIMHDDGSNGDAIAGDHLYTAVVIIDEETVTTLQFQVSAAFTGLLKRVTATGPALEVRGVRLSTLAKTSPIVIEGTILSFNAYYGEFSFIFTDIQLTNVSTIIGSPVGNAAVVVVRGGTIGPEIQQPPGREPFVTGDKLLLLIDGPDSNGKYFIPTDSLGIFRIKQGSNGTQLAVVDGGYTFDETVYQHDPSYEALLKQSRMGSLTVEALIAKLVEQ